MKFTEQEQFKNGKSVEAWLDAFFRKRGWVITQTTPYQERVLCLGDRRFVRGDVAYWIEYKSGIQTYYTGNIFLETVSVDTQGNPGWVLTCQADYIFYAALLNAEILIFAPAQLREKIPELKRLFREVQTHTQNAAYHTHGLIVPLSYAEKHLALKILTIST